MVECGKMRKSFKKIDKIINIYYKKVKINLDIVILV